MVFHTLTANGQKKDKVTELQITDRATDVGLLGLLNGFDDGYAFGPGNVQCILDHTMTGLSIY